MDNTEVELENTENLVKWEKNLRKLSHDEILKKVKDFNKTAEEVLSQYKGIGDTSST